jgi:glutathione S-transferase
MRPVITAFERSPDRGRGLARDMRIRWALEEVGQPYDVRFVSFETMKQPAHLARHPFGQIPTYEEDGLVLFESGAILLHLAEHHAGLLPDDANAQARAIAWMSWAIIRTWPPMSPGARRVPPTGALSRRSWRFSPKVIRAALEDPRGLPAGRPSGAVPARPTATSAP